MPGEEWPEDVWSRAGISTAARRSILGAQLWGAPAAVVEENRGERTKTVWPPEERTKSKGATPHVDRVRVRGGLSLNRDCDHEDGER